MPIDPCKTAVVLIEYQNDFTSDGGVLHGAVEEVMDKTGMLANTKQRGRGGPRGRRHRHARADHVRRGLQRDHLPPLRDPQGRRRRQRLRQGTPGAPRSSTTSPRRTGDIVVEGKRGLDTFASTNLDFILRSKGITDHRARRVPHELLRRVHDALRLRERLPGHHPHRLRRRHLDRGARQRHQVRLPDVLQADELGRSSSTSSAERLKRRSAVGCRLRDGRNPHPRGAAAHSSERTARR